MDYSSRLNTELIQREALKVLFDHLNNKIVSMRPTWDSEDEDFWNYLSRGNQDWTVEEVEDENFYSGIIPSLIDADPDKYPNICTVAYIANPTGSSDDLGEIYACNLLIEVMVKSDDEEEINSRLSKTLDAIHMTFMDTLENKTLNNTALRMSPPRETKGDVFPAREFGSHGDTWYWQGGSLEYIVNKYVGFDD